MIALLLLFSIFPSGATLQNYDTQCNCSTVEDRLYKRCSLPPDLNGNCITLSQAGNHPAYACMERVNLTRNIVSFHGNCSGNITASIERFWRPFWCSTSWARPESTCTAAVTISRVEFSNRRARRRCAGKYRIKENKIVVWGGCYTEFYVYYNEDILLEIAPCDEAQDVLVEENNALDLYRIVEDKYASELSGRVEVRNASEQHGNVEENSVPELRGRVEENSVPELHRRVEYHNVSELYRRVEESTDPQRNGTSVASNVP